MIIKILKKIMSYLCYNKTRIRTKVRLLLWLKKRGKFKLFRLYIQEQLRKRHHVIIAEKAVIGSLRLPHPHNVVIGKNVRIGENCTVYHDVTIGQNLGLVPCIGDNVIIYTGAKIIGDVTVEDNAVIGANAVVTSDVPKNAIVAGIPAKVIRYRCEEDQFQ